MIGEVQSLLDQYWTWLRDRTSLREVGDWIEITTPYLDRHNDYLQIYAKRVNGGFILTDDGYILEDLEQSGCKSTAPNAKPYSRPRSTALVSQVNEKALEVRSVSRQFRLAEAQSCTGYACRQRSFLLGVAHDCELVLRRCRGLARSFRHPVYAKCEIHRQERLRSSVRFRHTEVESPARTRATDN